MPFHYTKKPVSGKVDTQITKVSKSKQPIQIDGIANEEIWQTSPWLPLNQLWLGGAYTAKDFSGRYKLAWQKDGLYVLAEITDNQLTDMNKDPLQTWWDDDCLEIFIDEDNSGGEHQYNHNAFAYHLALDGNVVDMSTAKTGKLYNSHLQSKRKTEGDISIWEVKISLYDDSYSDDLKNNPVQLFVGKKIGFALAYCDNDTSKHREHFIGSISVDGEDKNRGWIDANIFGTLELKN